LLVLPTKTLPGYPNDIQRKILPIFDTVCFMGGIINFKILRFCTNSVLEKNLLPNVFTVEILQPKLQGEVANVLNITTSTLDKENHFL
jgi:hypothetical protein